MKIFYIAGHGAGDKGACGNGFQEQERVRTLGKRLKELGGDNVLLSDFNRNYYRDNGISKLTLNTKEYAILEGHMNWGAAGARGANVHINGAFSADKYDKYLADHLAEMFPGRADKIVKRNDLANPKRAAAKGYNYRLVEFGFISDLGDVNTFKHRMDDICKIILAAFGLPVVSTKKNSYKGLMDGGLHVIQKKGNPTQYVTDGLSVKAIPNMAEKQALMDMYKDSTGADLATIVMEPKDFDDYMKLVQA